RERAEGLAFGTLLEGVAGITFRKRGSSEGATPDRLVRTPDRERITDLDSIPSPYLTDWFQRQDAERWIAAIIETNRGCPYSCTFCDWGAATASKIRLFSTERVFAEIDWVSKNRIEVLWFADSNFGIFPRDIDIA